MCAIKADQSIACWGPRLRLFIEDNDHLDAPKGCYTAIAASTSHSRSIKTDGTAACWGLNKDGQADAPEGHYTAIAAGWFHSCAIKTDETIACWDLTDTQPAGLSWTTPT